MSHTAVKVGQHNRLKVVDRAGFGVFLDGGQFDEILLPKRFVPEDCKVGDELDVFVYLDSDDCLIATTEKPLAEVGEFAFLKVKEVNKVGAFLDWNLGKDLLVPFREQRVKMLPNMSYVVYLHQDDTSRRIIASSRLHRFIDQKPEDLKDGQEVSLLVSDKTDLGFMAIINGQYQGLLFNQEIGSNVRTGTRLNGFIKRLRPDGKIDLCLRKPGFDQSEIDTICDRIMAELEASDGILLMNDKSDPEQIKKVFGVSKRSFKMAIGKLYKMRKIMIFPKGIQLTEH
ncbi:GntR family transcriptional regulator [Endozoicomonas sp. OPT23]|uniref:CvfB family protein n=1 Tax=Endozoicomonas sp. OPT23 TaxID=2072845 RepID=UPI00129BFF88|nr:S1-like domain-containing RNA-binding protein [Endozoicomonas sp. OPT23]MRI34657.1 GntR family transcriptional regulator [Endozoicomonas sp. OPT23]